MSWRRDRVPRCERWVLAEPGGTWLGLGGWSVPVLAGKRCLALGGIFRGGGGLPASVIGKRGEEGGKIPPKLSIAALEILLS